MLRDLFATLSRSGCFFLGLQRLKRKAGTAVSSRRRDLSCGNPAGPAFCTVDDVHIAKRFVYLLRSSRHPERHYVGIERPSCREWQRIIPAVRTHYVFAHVGIGSYAHVMSARMKGSRLAGSAASGLAAVGRLGLRSRRPICGGCAARVRRKGCLRGSLLVAVPEQQFALRLAL